MAEEEGVCGKGLYRKLHILDEDDDEVPVGALGGIYVEDGMPFEYSKEPEKTAGTISKQGWSTIDDIGYLDEGGFLFLSDRKADMIISGGVNIYQQELENVLTVHPKVYIKPKEKGKNEQAKIL